MTKGLVTNGYEREIGAPTVLGLRQGFIHNFVPQGSKNQL